MSEQKITTLEEYAGLFYVYHSMESNGIIQNEDNKREDSISSRGMNIFAEINPRFIKWEPVFWKFSQIYPKKSLIVGTEPIAV